MVVHLRALGLHHRQHHQSAVVASRQLKGLPGSLHSLTALIDREQNGFKHRDGLQQTALP